MVLGLMGIIHLGKVIFLPSQKDSLYGMDISYICPFCGDIGLTKECPHTLDI